MSSLKKEDWSIPSFISRILASCFGLASLHNCCDELLFLSLMISLQRLRLSAAVVAHLEMGHRSQVDIQTRSLTFPETINHYKGQVRIFDKQIRIKPFTRRWAWVRVCIVSMKSNGISSSAPGSSLCASGCYP